MQQAHFKLFKQGLAPFAGFGSHGQGMGKGIGQFSPGRGLKLVPLVQDEQTGHTVKLHFCQNGFNGADLLQQVRVRGVGHMQKQVGGFQLLKGGAKRVHQLFGQIADKAYGVRQDKFFLGRKAQAPCGGIKRGEKFVFHQDLRAGERVEQGGFARIGVAHQRRQRNALA